MGVTMIIRRKEVEAIKPMKKWLLVFGRRKTGKTFLVENFLDVFFRMVDRK
jgi:AAA+ ATPase superfamily predicted ATPase